MHSKKNYLFLILSLVLLGCSSIPKRPDGLGVGPVEFTYESPLRWQLENGLIVYYLFDDELPQMQGTLYVRGGSYYEPAQQVGLASATGAQMRAGGTQKLAPAALDSRLDALGATVTSSFEGEFGSFGFYSLSSDFSEVFSIFSDVIRQPRFDTARLELWKRLVKEGIVRRKDDPGTIAGLTFQQLVYGQDSPYARAATQTSIDKLSVKDMTAFHQMYLRPNDSVLAVTGNMPVEEFKQFVQKHFADWKKHPIALAPLPEVTAALEPGVYLLNKNFEQATMLVGHRGPIRLSPSMYTMRVFNTAFGYSSFSSVLFEEIRTRLGLAYSAYGGFEGEATTGQFQVSVGTRVAQAPLAWKEVVRLSEQARQELPDEARFQNAKDSAQRSYVFRFADASAIVTRAAMLEMLGYPKDFDATYLEKIRAVTRQDVKAFAAKEIDPKNFVTVIVGKISPETLRAQLGENVVIHEVSFDEVPIFGR